jgi:hypothetical protein
MKTQKTILCATLVLLFVLTSAALADYVDVTTSFIRPYPVDHGIIIPTPSGGTWYNQFDFSTGTYGRASGTARYQESGYFNFVSVIDFEGPAYVSDPYRGNNSQMWIADVNGHADGFINAVVGDFRIPGYSILLHSELQGSVYFPEAGGYVSLDLQPVFMSETPAAARINIWNNTGSSAWYDFDVKTDPVHFYAGSDWGLLEADLSVSIVGSAVVYLRDSYVYVHGTPEPATVCLLGLGGLALLRRRKREDREQRADDGGRT